MNNRPLLLLVSAAASVLIALCSFAVAQPRPVNPAASVPTSLPPCGPLFTGNAANAKALCGSSESADGVLGVSTGRNGVVGSGSKAGVVGTSRRSTGLGVSAENTGAGTALSAKTAAEAYPAAAFTNTHPSGPHIWAGPPNAPVFEVKNDGRVFVQGSQIGLKGDRGEKGATGERGERGTVGPAGPPGSVVRSSVAVCGYATSCGCNTTATLTIAALPAPLGGACSAVADNNSYCRHDDSAVQRGPGMCCVCLPL